MLDLLPLQAVCQADFTYDSTRLSHPTSLDSPATSYHLLPEVHILDTSTDSGNSSASSSSARNRDILNSYIDAQQIKQKDSDIEQSLYSSGVYDIDKAFDNLTRAISDIISPDVLQTSFDTSQYFSSPADLFCVCTTEESNNSMGKTPDHAKPVAVNPYVEMLKKQKHKEMGKKGEPHDDGIDSTQRMLPKSDDEILTSDEFMHRKGTSAHEYIFNINRLHHIIFTCLTQYC